MYFTFYLCLLPYNSEPNSFFLTFDLYIYLPWRHLLEVFGHTHLKQHKRWLLLHPRNSGSISFFLTFDLLRQITCKNQFIKHRYMNSYMCFGIHNEKVQKCITIICYWLKHVRQYKDKWITIWIFRSCPLCKVDLLKRVRSSM